MQAYDSWEPALSQLMQKFGAAEACWFSSVRKDGRAHLAPIWHVLHEGRIYVVTQRNSVRAANIRHHAAVSLALADTSNALIVEGMAQPKPAMREQLRPLFQEKYGWDIHTDPTYDDVIEVTPTKVIAWGDHGNGRWRL